MAEAAQKLGIVAHQALGNIKPARVKRQPSFYLFCWLNSNVHL